MSRTVEIELGDFEYDIEVTYFDPGQEPKGWDPGAGAEIELGEKVDVWMYDEQGHGKKVKSITLDEFLEIYIVAEGIRKMTDEATRAAARAQLEEYCIDDVIGQLEDDYDDSDV